MSSVFTQKYFKNFQSFFEKSIDKLKIVCYNILVKRLRDNRKIKEGKRKMKFYQVIVEHGTFIFIYKKIFKDYKQAELFLKNYLEFNQDIKFYEIKTLETF